MSTVNRKVIASNTLVLYIRMALVMLVSLYTSRVVLDKLGEVDFGLYGAVGGIVVAFSFLNNIMSSACNRYFAIDLGKGDYTSLHKVFCLNVSVFAAFTFITVLLSETLGLWFLNAKMVFPADRAAAVQWVFHMSILSFAVNMLSSPYRSMVIAREKMKVFAYSSVVEAILKLGTVLLLAVSPIDRLVFYSILMMLVNAGVSLFYFFYCNAFWKECRYRFYWDRDKFREIVGYTGWNTIGSLSAVGRSQGLNILLNMFYGPAVNAARAIAYQVYYTVSQFVSNFMSATMPQITKSYSAGERQEMMKLIFTSSKICYLLLFIIVLPLGLEMPSVLDVWLKEVPQSTVLFARLVLINGLIDALSQPMMTAIQATGRVKWYQIVVGGILLLILPVAYILLKTGTYPAQIVFIISIAFSLLAFAARLVFMKRILSMSIRSYTVQVLLRCLAVSLLCAPAPLLAMLLIPSGLGQFLAVCALSVAGFAASVLLIGLTADERKAFFK